MNKITKCYRFVTDELKSWNGNVQWELGKWQKHKGELELCHEGLHACISPLDSLNYINGDRWFISEAKGKIVKDNDKFVAGEMRLVKEIPIIVLKRFSLFCAKDCLKYYTKKYPDDNRVSECIRITEAYLDGKATLDELSAAGSAARSAAGSAARRRQNKELLRLIKEAVK